MDIELTIEAFTTRYHENITDEFIVTQDYIGRLVQVYDKWEHKFFKIRVDDGLTPDEIENILVSRKLVPTKDSEGEVIRYFLSVPLNSPPQTDVDSEAEARERHRIYLPGYSGYWFYNTLSPQPENEDVKLPIANLLRQRAYKSDLLNRNESLHQQRVKDGDTLLLHPWWNAGGVDPLAIVASTAAVVQVVLMVADMWSRKAKKNETIEKKQNPPQIKEGKSNTWDEVKEIRVEMSDGDWITFKSWLANPEKIKGFLAVYSSPSNTVKPVKVIFLLKNGTKAIMEISDDIESKEKLEKFIEFLKM